MLSKLIKRILIKPHLCFTNFFFDPWEMLKKWFGLFHLIRNALVYSRRYSGGPFCIALRNLYYRSYDRYALAGSVPVHYFLQDVWAARYVFEHKFPNVVDVGSRFDGYIGHLLTFCDVTYVDIRPLDIRFENLKFVGGDITSLPFDDNSVSCLSSLHVIEHIGLGRYGDQVDPEGHLKAAGEIQRVLSPGGTLILSTVIGRERLCFDAHRIFEPKTVKSMFEGLTLEVFSLIDDTGLQVTEEANFESAKNCIYGCGLFIFRKKEV